MTSSEAFVPIGLVPSDLTTEVAALVSPSNLVKSNPEAFLYSSSSSLVVRSLLVVVQRFV